MFQKSHYLLIMSPFKTLFCVILVDVLWGITYVCSMGYSQISLKLPTDYDSERLKKKIGHLLGITDFTYQIENKSLDARKKNNIHWQLRLMVHSDELGEGTVEKKPGLHIPYKKRNKKVVVVGNGPAGFFSALVLQKAGFQTTLIDRGTAVTKRAEGIMHFEQTGLFDPKSNYAFGEGGAGTFSDGKLSSRSKRISLEKQFILSSYVKAGGPEEIEYMTHPHLGSDRLKIIVHKLNQEFQELGGQLLFETMLDDIKVVNGAVVHANSSAGNLEADYFIIAAGHSAYETFRMLMKRGVGFHTKNFAIGSRMEHPQELINRAQWGKPSLPGVKAAEYRLTAKTESKQQVYTFCMCPGGLLVPATAYEGSNIVNGMSLYQRDAQYANAACVSGLNLEQLLGREVSASESLDWLEQLERKFYSYTSSYAAPFCSIQDFIKAKSHTQNTETSYPLGLKAAPLWEMLPKQISENMRQGLNNFSKKIQGFETGNIMGLESKTSASIQVDRDENRLCHGFSNLYMVGEGSGFAGGIVSSAADGIKAAMSLVHANT